MTRNKKPQVRGDFATTSETISYIPLHEASKLIPGNPTSSSLHRWSDNGIKGVKLRIIHAGSRKFTTVAWVEQFIAELNAPKG